MTWLLPIMLVLCVALLIAAIHLLFMRWMARQPEPVAAREPLADDSSVDRT
jgi:cell division protein FtsL